MRTLYPLDPDFLRANGRAHSKSSLSGRSTWGFEDRLKVRGYLEISIHDKHGNLVRTVGGENLVVTQGRSAMMKLLAGDSTPDFAISHMNWADGGHDPGEPTATLPGIPDPSDIAFAGDSVLVAPGKVVTFSYPDGDYPTGTRVRFEAALGLLEGNGPGAQAISEAGLFMGSGDMFAHKA